MLCPRCFYFAINLGVKQPGIDPESFKLPNAVDELIKKEFAICRNEKVTPDIIAKHGIAAIPFVHSDIKRWQNAKTEGIQYYEQSLNITLSGGVDEILITPMGELIIIEFKSTVTDHPINSLSAVNKWHSLFKKQISFYAWLFKKNGFKVHAISYFIFCNGLTSKPTFNQKLEFESSVIPYTIDDSWVEHAIQKALNYLDQPQPPAPAKDCDYCIFTKKQFFINQQFASSPQYVI